MNKNASGNNMRLYYPNGQVLIEAISLKKEGRDLVMKAKVMNAMVTAVCVRPEEVWKGKRLISLSVILYLPVMIIRGMWGSLRKK